MAFFLERWPHVLHCSRQPPPPLPPSQPPGAAAAPSPPSQPPESAADTSPPSQPPPPLPPSQPLAASAARATPSQPPDAAASPPSVVSASHRRPLLPPPPLRHRDHRESRTNGSAGVSLGSPGEFSTYSLPDADAFLAPRSRRLLRSSDNKNTRETSFTLEKMALNKAKRYLEDVLARKQAIPFHRYCRGVGRTAQAKNCQPNGHGRWPAKSAQFVLDLLKNAESNAEVCDLIVPPNCSLHV